MPFLDIAIPGLDGAIEEMKALKDRAESAAGRVMLKLAQSVAAEAKSEIETRHVSARGTAPDERTGTLDHSIVAKMAEGTTSQVEADADYARFVEYGTRKMAPRPFMRLAIAAVLPRFSLAQEMVGELALDELKSAASDAMDSLK